MASLPLFRRRSADAERDPSDPDLSPPPRSAVPPAGAGRLRAADRASRRRGLRAVLVVVLIAGALIAVMWGASTPVLAGAQEGIRWLDARNSMTGRAVLTVGIAAGGLLALVIAWSRATAPRRPVRLADGRGTIAVAEVEERLESLWLERSDVVAARAAIENRHRRGLRVAGRIAVTADARLQETAAAAAVVAEMLVEGQLGVELAAQPRLELRYRELDLRAGRTHDFRAARARAGEADDVGDGHDRRGNRAG